MSSAWPLYVLQGGDVIRLRHAEVEGQLAGFPPLSRLATHTASLVSTSVRGVAKRGAGSSPPMTPGSVSLLVNPEEDDTFGSSLSLWEVRAPLHRAAAALFRRCLSAWERWFELSDPVPAARYVDEFASGARFLNLRYVSPSLCANAFLL